MTPPVLTHLVQGNGPPVLLLNGGLMSVAAWDPVARALEPRHRVVRCDFRGQLRTPGPPPPTLGGHARDLVELLDAIGFDEVHVAGTSFGALVGIVLASGHPARVRSLTAIAATDRISATMWAGSVALRDACLEAAGGGDGTVVFHLVEPATFSAAWLAANADLLRARRQAVGALPAFWFLGIAGLLSSLHGLDLRPVLERVQCPTLVVAGERDATFPVEHSRELASGIRGAALEVVAGGTHGLVVEQAAVTASIVERFVSAVELGKDRGHAAEAGRA